MSFNSEENVKKLATAIEEGRRAWSGGLKVGQNPYPENSGKHWQWMQGWTEAGLADLRKRT